MPKKTSSKENKDSANTRWGIAEIETENLLFLEKMLGSASSKNADKVEAAFTKEITNFVLRVREAGITLYSMSERKKAQSVLNYWSSELIGNPHAPKDLPMPLLLARADPSKAPDLSKISSPYVGLNAFSADDKAKYFGRDDAVAELSKIVLNTDLTIVTGPSGSGKSSLVLAGLIPRMEKTGEGKTKVLEIMDYITPGKDPWARLMQLLMPANLPSSEIVKAVEKISKSPKRINDYLDNVGDTENGKVLIVDQFEEVFTLCNDEEWRHSFVKAIASIKSPHHVVITVRQDFRKDLNRLLGPQKKNATSRQIFSPKTLSYENLRDVIIKPANAVGLKFDDSVVEELIDQVRGDPAALPLLQFALQQLWKHKDRNRITRAVYDEVGRPQDALGRAADKVYEKLSHQNKVVAEDLFKRLVYPDKANEFLRQRVTRDLLRQSSTDERVDQVLAEFVESGLLKKQKGVTAETDLFEVTHEALIRNWPELDKWLQESKELQRDKLHLIEIAEIWNTSGRAERFLLNKSRLETASNYQGQSPKLDDLLRHSKLQIDKEQKQSVQKLYIGIFAASVLATFAVGGWTMSFLTGQDLKKERDEARDKNEALNIAIENYKAFVKNTPEAHDQLRERMQDLNDFTDLASSKEGLRELVSLSNSEISSWLKSEERRLKEYGLDKDDLEKLDAKINKQSQQQNSKATKEQYSETTQEQSTERLPIVVQTSKIQPSMTSKFCSGAMWIGSRDDWKVKLSNGKMNVKKIGSGTILTAETHLKLREDLPDQADYKSKEQVGTVVKNVQIKATGKAEGFKRSSGTQYWVPIEAPAASCYTIYIQYSDDSQKVNAKRIYTTLREKYGYYVPAIEKVSQRLKATEVRIFKEADNPVAKALMKDFNEIVTMLDADWLLAKNDPRLLGLSAQDKTIELWLAPPKKSSETLVQTPAIYSYGDQTKWTKWINRDRPGGVGDFESVAKSGYCAKPVDIECRRSSDEMDWRKTGDNYLCEADIGGQCRNDNQKDGQCDDYEVKFLCSTSPRKVTRNSKQMTTKTVPSTVVVSPNYREPQWTPWLNRDDPSGKGDYETISDFINRDGNKDVCATPLNTECRRQSDKVDWSQTKEIYSCASAIGGQCVNANQPDGKCDDYEVRFLCPK